MTWPVPQLRGAGAQGLNRKNLAVSPLRQRTDQTTLRTPIASAINKKRTNKNTCKRLPTNKSQPKHQEVNNQYKTINQPSLHLKTSLFSSLFLKI